ncbi:TraK family protein [Pseudoduganella aquatica]|uniref:TraK n=1 Tax=Pseudoduganella aquatica TaxID=2660641 RepID=A0A7X4KM53_9BURK|nr:TraK family protein [Pseudoduganella aquatica]MYN08889.1 traK [Pseudoduganella aquatica]
MGKNYPDQLGDWVRQRAATTRDKNLVAFLAVRDDVRAALDAGYAAKTVWSNLRESKRIAVSYTAFLRYVRKFLNQSDDAASSQPAPSTKTAAVSEHNDRPAKPAGFVFNPKPKKEELL